ncbi:hypothetical protein AKJ09_02327 [Labilithrix luteola]|uniref:Uncharacterized protein n=1 Tax=Labilithrix luteola TaxID=1391654 RepID=A0A0K1PQ56_9BACT|nr:hypothetical protein AKJ09_02327 [Labilithrix luteola]
MRLEKVSMTKNAITDEAAYRYKRATDGGALIESRCIRKLATKVGRRYASPLTR